MPQAVYASMTDPICGPGGRKAHQAYRILHAGYITLPIVAGADKFFHLLANWDQYLCGTLAAMLPISPHLFMRTVGAVEIAVGLLVAFAPRLGAYVVAAWLMGIIWNLLLIPGFYDIALRDFGLALGALALARLSPPARAAFPTGGTEEEIWVEMEGRRETA